MDVLIVAKANTTQQIEDGLRNYLFPDVRITSVPLVELAERHLVYSSPDYVIVVGSHPVKKLGAFSELLSRSGSRLLMADSLREKHYVLRRAGRQAAAKILKRGESVVSAIGREVDSLRAFRVLQTVNAIVETERRLAA